MCKISRGREFMVVRYAVQISELVYISIILGSTGPYTDLL